jgi:UDP-N-acetylmuramate--alanine ligase
VPRAGTIPTLDVPDPSIWRRLHLIGAGGAGMSGIARLLMARGIHITGSDLKESRTLRGLEQAGATVFVGHRAEQIGAPDAVVVSSAIPPENHEVREARRRGIPVLMRAQVLASLMRDRASIAVAGTHGKTTTTSMIAVILGTAGLSPTFVIGGDLNETGSGAGHGAGDLFVAETDESDGSFLLLEPRIAVITNVEVDHVDFYPRGRDEVEAAFAAFAARASTVVACWDDEGVRRALAASPVALRYGMAEGADALVCPDPGRTDGVGGSIRFRDAEFRVTLPLPGAHNLMNAAAALCVARLVGVDLEAAVDALRSFTGVRRRFERRGEVAGALFVDDYAHHPTEVAATLAAARGQGRRVVAVFQPHRYTRTEAMWRELGQSLRHADVAVVTDVYPAGERPIPGVSGKLVVDALTEAVPGHRVVYLPRRSDVPQFLLGEVRPGDLVITLGAGDITHVGEELLGLLG